MSEKRHSFGKHFIPNWAAQAVEELRTAGFQPKAG
jgi:hypothetical protein